MKPQPRASGLQKTWGTFLSDSLIDRDADTQDQATHQLWAGAGAGANPVRAKSRPKPEAVVTSGLNWFGAGSGSSSTKDVQSAGHTHHSAGTGQARPGSDSFTYEQPACSRPYI